MKEQTGHFEGVRGFQLFYKAWLPDSSPKAVLAIVHGAGEHIDRYENLVDALVPAGFMLTGYDQRGHGRSEGQRGHINSWSEYREDIRIFLALAGKLAPGLPLFLFGHSMGSLEVLDYILHYSEGLAGAIISGTGLDPKGSAAPPHLVLLAKALTSVVPSTVVRMKLEGSSLSRNPQVAKAYMEDPLVHWCRSVRWGTESLKVIEWIKSRAGEINMPVLFLHGECDPLLTAAGAQRFFEQVRFPDKTIHVYPGCLHEPHNDLDYKQVISDIESWMDRHIAIAHGSVRTPEG
jgi:alpha-beta hydrolase superfamily lysophospholipase